jgi:uncharacterized protein YjdB
MTISKCILVLPLAIILFSTGCGFFLSENDLNTIDLSPTSYFAVVGEQKQFTATGTTVGGSTVDATDACTWSSSSTSVATVNSTGLVTAVSDGSGIATTTIKAKTSTASTTTTVTVSNTALTSLTLSPTSATVIVGGTRQLGLIAKFLDNSSYSAASRVTWSSSDTSVATISDSGLVTAIAAGSVTITATAENADGVMTESMTVTVSST